MAVKLSDGCLSFLVAASPDYPPEEGLSCLSFSPHPESDNLLAIGTKTKIVVKSCTIREDDSGSDRGLLELLDVEHVYAVMYKSPNCVSWSPAASTAMGQFRFCASRTNCGEISVFSSTQTSTTTKPLPGHNTAVNDLCAHPSDETLLASVGEDCACRIWDLQEGKLRSEFKLGSPGMTVRWHEKDPMKLMVAEKNGRIRIYDVSTNLPLQSLDCPAPPLICADWAPSNSLVVGGVAGNSWYRWDLSQSSQPLESREIHKGSISRFRWCMQSEKVFATVTAASQLKIHHLAHQKVPVACDLGMASDISWHPRIPLVGVAAGRHVKCWAVEP